MRLGDAEKVLHESIAFGVRIVTSDRLVQQGCGPVGERAGPGRSGGRHSTLRDFGRITAQRASNKADVRSRPMFTARRTEKVASES